MTTLSRRLVPPGAVPFETSDVQGYAWNGSPTFAMGGLAVYAGLYDGRAVVGIAVCDGQDAAEAVETYVERRPAARNAMMPWAILDIPVRRGGDGGDGREAFARRFVDGLDFEAFQAIAAAASYGPDAYHWIAHGGQERSRRLAFARAYPWALDPFVEAGAEFWGDTDEEALLDLVRSRDLGSMPGDARAKRVVAATRGLSFTGQPRHEVISSLKAAAALPSDWIPDDGHEVEALVRLVPHARSLARVSGGRGIVDLVRPTKAGWAAHANRLVAPLGQVDPDGRRGLERLARVSNEMIDACLQQVVRPAALALDPRADALVSREYDQLLLADHHRADVLRAAAARIILGQRRMAGFAEAVGRWVSGSTELWRTVARLAGPSVSWPRAFPDVKAPGGIVVTCLSDASALHDEGAPGHDPSGNAGLSHCVASYLVSCLDGHSRIASLRRDAERLSTVEFVRGHDGRPEVRQHHGRGNSEPPRECSVVLERFVHAVSGGRTSFDPDAFARPPGPASGVLSSVYAANREDVARAWTPHLPSGLDPADPVALLKAGGLSPETLRSTLDARTDSSRHDGHVRSPARP